MRLPFTFHHPLFPDGLEVEVKVEIDWHGGEPVIDATGVWLDGRSLTRSNDRLDRDLSVAVMTAAEESDDLFGDALAADGAWHTGGPNNPDAKWMR